MTEEPVTVAVFHDYRAAREAANRLNAAGIPTSFAGEAAATAGAGFAPTVITLWLQVPGSFVDRALALLESDEPLAEEPDDFAMPLEEDEYNLEPRGIVKELLGDAVGVFLDAPLRNLNSTAPGGEPDATPPRTMWGALGVFLALLLFLLSMILSVFD
jgi:hypothetical protein